MIGIVRFVFLSRHGELRSGWRMAAFLLLGSAVLLALGGLVNALGIDGRYIQLAVALIAAGVPTFIMTRFINHKPFTSVGLSLHPSVVRELGLGVFLGFLMMAGIFLVMFALGYLRLESRGLPVQEILRVLLESAIVFALAAFFEEFVFRGYLFQTLIQGITFLPATLLFALFFSAAHAWNPNTAPLAMVNIALAGIWLSFAYMKTRRLWLPAGLHFSWNFAQTSVFGLPTSGNAMADRTVVQSIVNGPEWITGGAFGPEGGILATLAIILCTVHVLKSGMYTPPANVVTLDSLEDLLPREPGREKSA